MLLLSDFLQNIDKNVEDLVHDYYAVSVIAHLLESIFGVLGDLKQAVQILVGDEILSQLY